MTARLSPRVEPAAALELVSLIQQQTARMIAEHEPEALTQPHVAYQLAGALESLLRDLGGDRLVPIHRALDADAVAKVRWSVQVGRRLDMTSAFDRLNPGFGVRAEHGCWDATAEQRQRRTAAQRRELALALGERVADALAGVRPCRGKVQVPACDRCSQGVLDTTNPHLYGQCACSCHVQAEGEGGEVA